MLFLAFVFLTIDSCLKAVKKEKLVRKFQHETNACINIHAPSTHARFRLKKEIFSPTWPTVHTYPVKTVIENASFQKTLSRVEVFENAVLLFSS